MSLPPPHPSSGQAWFATTHWSRVLAANTDSSSTARAALEELCRTYWYPLYAFVRRTGKSPQDAEDLVQGFFAACLEKDYLRKADPGKGRFRSFLLMALKRYLANEWDKEQTHKRGGGQELVWLDGLSAEQRYAMEPADQMTADRLYERRWAMTLLDQVLARLKQEQNAQGKGEHFDQLKEFLVSGGRGTPYAAVAAQMDMTESAVKVAIHRLRQRYRVLLEEAIASTVESPGDVETERRHLLSSLSD